MFLLVDNSTDDKVIFHVYMENSWMEKQYLSGEHSVVGALECFLREENKRLSDLRGLAVIVGKGKFTATRIAVTVANSLAFALKIPVLSVTAWTNDLHEKISQSQIGQYISAQYSAAANIGKKK